MANVAAEIKAKGQTFVQAFDSGNPDNILALFADDCLVVGHGNAVHKGKEGVKGHLAQIKATGATTLKAVESSYESGALGDGFAFHNGMWDAFNKDGAKVTTFKDLVIWKKVNGDWKVFRESTDHC